jgi:biopolymer transport protein ExbD
MAEVTGPIIAIMLVLLSVFMPDQELERKMPICRAC